MQLLRELFTPEILDFAVIRTIQLIPFMVLFGFLGHLLDKDNARFRKEQEEKERKEKLKDYF